MAPRNTETTKPALSLQAPSMIGSRPKAAHTKTKIATNRPQNESKWTNSAADPAAMAIKTSAVRRGGVRRAEDGQRLPFAPHCEAREDEGGQAAEECENVLSRHCAWGLSAGAGVTSSRRLPSDPSMAPSRAPRRARSCWPRSA